MSRMVDWPLTDISGQSIDPIFKGQTVLLPHNTEDLTHTAAEECNHACSATAGISPINKHMNWM